MLAGMLKHVNQIQNVYIGDENYPDLRNHIFVLYKFSGNRPFLKYEDSIRENNLFELSYDPDKIHVMMVFRVPTKNKLDFFQYKQSKYSEMSRNYKAKILQFHKVNKQHILYHVLNRTEEGYRILEQEIGAIGEVPRGQEVSSALNMSKEVYGPDKYVTESIQPNERFLSGRPLRFNTREGE
jgi:hypothetical protein